MLEIEHPASYFEEGRLGRELRGLRTRLGVGEAARVATGAPRPARRMTAAAQVRRAPFERIGPNTSQRKEGRLPCLYVKPREYFLAVERHRGRRSMRRSSCGTPTWAEATLRASGERGGARVERCKVERSSEASFIGRRGKGMGRLRWWGRAPLAAASMVVEPFWERKGARRRTDAPLSIDGVSRKGRGGGLGEGRAPGRGGAAQLLWRIGSRWEVGDEPDKWALTVSVWGRGRVEVG